MPAKNRADLIDLTELEYAKLSALLDRTPDELRLAPDKEGVTIKDIVVHRAHWIDLFIGWRRDGLAGVPVHFPALGYKWNDLKRYNADLRERRAGLSWEEARSELREAHSRLTGLLGALTNDALYGGPMKGAKNAWTTGRWAEASGPSHYRSAAKYIRARQRASAPR